MSGTFNPSSPPVLPGVYTHYSAVPGTALPSGAGGLVAIPLTHNWGPANTLTFLGSFGNWESLFGTDESQGRRAVYDAFRGEGVEGRGGASGVYVVRMASSSAAKAVVKLNNPAKANAVTIKGRYPGTRGNRLQIIASAVVAGKQTITVLDGTAELESFSVIIAEENALKLLVAAINAVSPWVEAELVAEGATGIEPGTTALASGADGATLTGEDWTNGVNRLNDVDFALVAPYDLPWTAGEPGASVRATVNLLKAWRLAQAEAGHRFTLVVGGALEEDPATAVQRALEMADPGIITVGGPGVLDETFGKLSSSQLAARIAGIRAQRGETQAAHFARLGGTLPLAKSSGAMPTLTEIVTMVEAGVMCLQRDRYAAAPTRIVKDVNTWAPKPRTPQETERPRRVYGQPKKIQSMQQFANECEQELERTMIGKSTVNNSTRQAAAAFVLKKGGEREKSGAFQSKGITVKPEAGTEADDFVKLKVEIAFGNALAQLFLNASVS